MDDKYMDKYRIPSARAPWHDYAAGTYFITICTKRREHYFGEIEEGNMLLSEVGKYAEQCIVEIPNHNPYANVPQYVIMPNHLHLIVVISSSVGRDAPWCVSDNIATFDEETHHGASLQGNDADNVMKKMAQRKGKLSVTIGGLKQSITRFAIEKSIEFAWQTRFHDHIIRDSGEMNRIATYIENNVSKWTEDKFYTPRKL